jgi:hypothetical protein
VSRSALENALFSYAPRAQEGAIKNFLGGLSVDELLYLAEFLGSCILIASAAKTDIWDVIVHRAHACQRRVRLTARQREDTDHKLLLVSEFAARCGFLVKFR